MKNFLLYLIPGGNLLLPVGIIHAENLEEAIAKTEMKLNGEHPPYPINGTYLLHKTGAKYLLIELKEIHSAADLS